MPSKVFDQIKQDFTSDTGPTLEWIATQARARKRHRRSGALIVSISLVAAVTASVAALPDHEVTIASDAAGDSGTASLPPAGASDVKSGNATSRLGGNVRAAGIAISTFNGLPPKLCHSEIIETVGGYDCAGVELLGTYDSPEMPTEVEIHGVLRAGNSETSSLWNLAIEVRAFEPTTRRALQTEDLERRSESPRAAVQDGQADADALERWIASTSDSHLATIAEGPIPGMLAQAGVPVMFVSDVGGLLTVGVSVVDDTSMETVRSIVPHEIGVRLVPWITSD